jgi:hypothetical protein
MDRRSMQALPHGETDEALWKAMVQMAAGESVRLRGPEEVRFRAGAGE